MAGRKKLQFTEEQDKDILLMISENKNLSEILEVLLSKYGLKTNKATLASHIRTIDADWKPTTAGRKCASNVCIDANDLLERLCRYQSIASIASELKCSKYVVNKMIENVGYDNNFIQNYKEVKYFSELGENGPVDLRSLKRKYADEIIKGIRTRLKEAGVKATIVKDNLITTDEFSAIIDFYIPEINRGYICNNSDEYLVEENKMLTQCRCCSRINKSCKTTVKTIEYEKINIEVEQNLGDGDYNIVNYTISDVPKVKEYTYDGLYIHPYMIDFDFDEHYKEGRMNIDRTITRLANEIISLYRNGCVRRNVDHKMSDKLGGQLIEIKSDFENMMEGVSKAGRRQQWIESEKKNNMCRFPNKKK